MSQTLPYTFGQIDDNGTLRNAAIFDCSNSCGTRAFIMLAKTLPPDVVLKKVQEKGWAPRKGGRVFVCPTCSPRGRKRIDTRMIHGREPVTQESVRTFSVSNVKVRLSLGTLRVEGNKNPNPLKIGEPSFIQGTSVTFTLYRDHLDAMNMDKGKRATVTYNAADNSFVIAKTPPDFLPTENSVMGRITDAGYEAFSLRVVFKNRTFWTAHDQPSAQQSLTAAPVTTAVGETLLVPLGMLVDHSPKPPTPIVTTDGLRTYAETEDRVQLAIANVQTDYERLLVSIDKLDAMVKEKQGRHAGVEVFPGAAVLDFKIGIKC